MNRGLETTETLDVTSQNWNVNWDGALNKTQFVRGSDNVTHRRSSAANDWASTTVSGNVRKTMRVVANNSILQCMLSLQCGKRKFLGYTERSISRRPRCNWRHYCWEVEAFFIALRHRDRDPEKNLSIRLQAQQIMRRRLAYSLPRKNPKMLMAVCGMQHADGRGDKRCLR